MLFDATGKVSLKKLIDRARCIAAKSRKFFSTSHYKTFCLDKGLLIRQSVYSGKGKKAHTVENKFPRPWGNAPDGGHVPSGTDSHLIAHT